MSLKISKDEILLIIGGTGPSENAVEDRFLDFQLAENHIFS